MASQLIPGLKQGCGPLEKGMRIGKPHQCSCVKNPMTSMQRQKDMTLNNEPHRSVSVPYGTGKARGNRSRQNKRVGPEQQQCSLRICLVAEVNFDAVKSNITLECELLGPSITVNWMWPSRRLQE